MSYNQKNLPILATLSLLLISLGSIHCGSAPSLEEEKESPIELSNDTQVLGNTVDFSTAGSGLKRYASLQQDDPHRVRTIEIVAKKGAKLTLTILPAGKGWQPKITIKNQSDNTELATATAIAAGGGAEISFTAPADGSYSLVVENETATEEKPRFYLKINLVQPTATQNTPVNTHPGNSDLLPGNGNSNNGNSNNGNPFDGLTGKAIIAKFQELNAGAKDRSPSQYRNARYEMFTKIDNHGGVVEGVYTGRKITTDRIPSSSNMNAEHTWPQSLGGGDSTKSDLHHLFPADAAANTRRSNDPFCEVVSVSWSEGGSKSGRDSKGKKCFEPRDVHKGNVARAMFYIAAMKGKSIDPEQEALLRKWHKADPVDAAELAREKAVYDYEKSHNYFILYPDLVDKISDF